MIVVSSVDHGVNCKIVVSFTRSWCWQQKAVHEGSFEGVLRVFQGVFKKKFKDLSASFKGDPGGCLRCFKGVSWKFQRCFQMVLKEFQESFKKMLKFFKRSFMFYCNYHSYPNRRWACFFTL